MEISILIIILLIVLFLGRVLLFQGDICLIQGEIIDDSSAIKYILLNDLYGWVEKLFQKVVYLLNIVDLHGLLKTSQTMSNQPKNRTNEG